MRTKTIIDALTGLALTILLAMFAPLLLLVWIVLEPWPRHHGDNVGLHS